jgi:hypothetical protein
MTFTVGIHTWREELDNLRTHNMYYDFSLLNVYAGLHAI